MTLTRVRLGVAIHPDDSAETIGIATQDRLLLVSALIARHDEGLSVTRELARTYARRLLDAGDFRTAADGQETLAREATLTLGLFKEPALLSFTFALLERSHVNIWNCGGHRAVGISKGVASCVVGDGFCRTDDPRYRTLMVLAADSDKPVSTSAIHHTSISLDRLQLVVFSPSGNLPFIDGIERATSTGDLLLILGAQDPLRRHSLASIEVWRSRELGNAAEPSR